VGYPRHPWGSRSSRARRVRPESSAKCEREASPDRWAQRRAARGRRRGYTLSGVKYRLFPLATLLGTGCVSFAEAPRLPSGLAERIRAAPSPHFKAHLECEPSGTAYVDTSQETLAEVKKLLSTSAWFDSVEADPAEANLLISVEPLEPTPYWHSPAHSPGMALLALVLPIGWTVNRGYRPERRRTWVRSHGRGRYSPRGRCDLVEPRSDREPPQPRSGLAPEVRARACPDPRAAATTSRRSSIVPDTRGLRGRGREEVAGLRTPCARLLENTIFRPSQRAVRGRHPHVDCERSPLRLGCPDETDQCNCATDNALVGGPHWIRTSHFRAVNVSWTNRLRAAYPSGLKELE